MSEGPQPQPQSSDVLLRRASGWLKSHLVNHAEITLRELLATDPENPVAVRLHGIALFKLGRREEGVAALRRAADLAPRNYRAWQDLAVALRDDGQAQAATEAHATALALQVAQAPVPPLAQDAFCTEIAAYDFKVVDYDYRAEVRYGAQRPAHPELAALIGEGRARYRDFLTSLGEAQPEFAAIPKGGAYAARTPFWLNAWFPPLAGMALMGMLRAHQPARFVEVGSGMSTKYARHAVSTWNLRTRLTSIDPQPRNAVDALCDEVIREPLERCDVTRFEALEAGDVFFLDSSHRAFQNSDVTVFFLEILPRLKPGVIVHVHDIYLPFDYIAGHLPRLWNEQYLLATALLFGPQRFEVLFPCWFVGRDPELSAHANAMLRRGPIDDLDLYGASFWMRMT